MRMNPFLADYASAMATPEDPIQSEASQSKAAQAMVHHMNIVKTWDRARPDEIHDGMIWYREAHHVTKALGEATNHSLPVASGIMAAYSPQTAWPRNLFNASHVLHLGHGVGGPADEQIRRQLKGMKLAGGSKSLYPASHKNRLSAQHIFETGHYKGAWNEKKSFKVPTFAELIHHGGMHPDDPTKFSDRVCVDTHSAGVAMGTRINSEAPVGLDTQAGYHVFEKAHQEAAKHLSRRYKMEIAPHQVQAVTWLVQQREAQEADLASGTPHGKGRAVTLQNSINDWQEHMSEDHPDITGYPTAYLPSDSGERIPLPLNQRAPDRSEKQRVSHLERIDPDDFTPVSGLYPRQMAALRRQAIDQDEFESLTDLPPLDLSRREMSKCSRCGGTLAPGESGLCPQCENSGPGRKSRQRQKMVRTQDGVKRMSMQHIAASPWRYNYQDRRSGMERAIAAHDRYGGTRHHVPIGNNTWIHKDDQGAYHVRHHHTDILSYHPGTGNITINPDGYRSSTTMQRINGLLPDHMSVRRNPSRAQGASAYVVAHNPTGGPLYPGWSRGPDGTHQRGERGKYGFHPDVVLHPFDDGFSINEHSGQVLPDDTVRPTGTTVKPPRARNARSTPSTPEPRSSETYYGFPSARSTPPAYTPPRSSTPMHEQGDVSGDIRRDLQRANQSHPDTYGDQVPMGFSHHDMPGEGESLDEWLDRTAPSRMEKCTNCRGKGTVRKSGPVPEGVHPWEHREDCPNCSGAGYLDAKGNPVHGHTAAGRVMIDREIAQEVYDQLVRLRVIAEIQAYAYGEIKAPVEVDTLRDEACPVCSETESFDGDRCQVCGYVAPPKMFQDPDLEQAKLLDLRNNPATGEGNDTNPNVGANLPPVSPDDVDEDGEIEGDENVEGDMVGLQAGEQTEDPQNPGVVEAEVEGLGDAGPMSPEDLDAEEDEQVNGATGGPEDSGAADRHFNQGGEPFTKGPNAPGPEEPMDPSVKEVGEPVAQTGQPVTNGDEGVPGNPGDGAADLLCPSCGFQADAATPTSEPGNVALPADRGDGMLEGDVCPQCQKATMMGVGQLVR